MSDWLQSVGFGPNDRVLIVNSDDFGMCEAANSGVMDAFAGDIVRSATVMTCCPWAFDAIARARSVPEAGIGVHLTLTSEWANYRWSPVLPRCEVPGLVDPDGFMWRSDSDVHRNATPDEAYRECRAQIEQGLEWGLEPTHLDSHMGTLQTHPDFIEVYLRLALDFGLPLRMAGQQEYDQNGFREFREYARSLGVVFTDDLILPERRRTGETRFAFWERTLSELSPGIHEMFIHASRRTPESERICPDIDIRDEERRMVSEGSLRQLISDQGIILSNYKPLAKLASTT